MQEKFIFISTNGTFLELYKVSSHSVEQKYAFRWVTDINEATVFDTFNLEYISNAYPLERPYTYESEIKDKIACALKVEEIVRKVRILS